MGNLPQDITLVTLYTKRTGFMCGSPPLLNMALLNIKHWQSQSEQDNILHVAGADTDGVRPEEGQELTIGSSSAASFTDRQKQGLEYVEHTGSSIGAGKESLADLVEQMRQAGAKLLRTKTPHQISRPDLGREDAGAVAALHHGNQPGRCDRQHSANHG
jgi:hypothetical protein